MVVENIFVLLDITFNAGRYKRQPFEPNASGLERLEWDGAELYKVC